MEEAEETIGPPDVSVRAVDLIVAPGEGAMNRAILYLVLLPFQ